MNLSLSRTAKLRLISVKQRHAVIQEVEPIEVGQPSPREFGIAPEDRQLLAVNAVQRLRSSDQSRHFDRRLCAVDQQPNVNVAVNRAISTMSETAERIGIY